MTFEEALKAMREGKKVKYNDEIYFLEDDYGYIYKKPRCKIDEHMFILAEFMGYDIVSDEWEIVEDDRG